MTSPSNGVRKYVDHWQGLYEFALHELAVGGPDPQLDYVAWMSRREDVFERAWRAGVFMSVYNVATAEIIWNEWPWARVYTAGGPPYMQPAGEYLLQVWISENWHKLRFRKERKAVGLDRSGSGLTRCLWEYARWASAAVMDIEKTRAVSYEELWRFANRIYSFGRYTTHKLLELLLRMGIVAARMPDIRPINGWSPRQTLELLWPEATAIAPRDNDARAITASNLAARVTKHELEERLGFELTWYDFQTFLCEYRESMGRQYPGRSHDSELRYFCDLFLVNPGSQIPAARSALVPSCALGEEPHTPYISGWYAPREQLGGCFQKRGYTWSDLVYDYAATGDLDHPVRREDVTSESIRDRARATVHARTHQPADTAR